MAGALILVCLLAQVPDAAPEDALIDFDSEHEVQVERGPVTVTVAGQDLTSRMVIREVKTPVIGRHRRELSWPEFYRTVGAPELARAYAQRALLSVGLQLTGLAMSIGSGLPMLVGMTAGLLVIFLGQGSTTLALASVLPVGASLSLGLGMIFAGAAGMTALILVGGGTLWLGRNVEVQPVENADILRLAEEYNARVLAAE